MDALLRTPRKSFPVRKAHTKDLSTSSFLLSSANHRRYCRLDGDGACRSGAKWRFRGHTRPSFHHLGHDSVRSRLHRRGMTVATACSVPPSRPVVFLLDVDNTLLDHDRVIGDVMRYLEREVGPERQERYWKIFDELRAEIGYADYLGALQRYRLEHPHDSHVLAVSSHLINYPFANRLFPESLDVIDHLKQWATCVIVTDGDVVFQPWKIERSGLFDAVDGNVLIYVHKERELDDVERRYPADHYVMVDDKLRLLAAIKETWMSRVTTIFVRQGRYARDPQMLSGYPPADITVERIGQLLSFDLETLLHGGVRG